VKTLLFTSWMIALPLVGSAVDFSTVEIAGKRVTVCRVDITKERIQLFHLDETGQPFKRFDRLSSWLQQRGQKLVFAMNGGMFRPDFSPVGLFVSDGHESVPLNSAPGDGNFFLKPNGVFAITTGSARVIETSEYPRIRERVIVATQSGPLLVRAGKIHPAFNAKSESRHIRNGVGVPSPDVVLFAISEVPVTFYEFATLFRDKLHCPDALFLDGAISKLHSTKLQRSGSRTDFGPIIAVTE
jgi:uncharacterized protein YigE (DUF2233 family)